MRYGWKPDLPDFRDLTFSAPTAPLPKSVDLRAKMPPVQDQLNLGSCTAHMAVAIYAYVLALKTGTFVAFSRLAAYYETRKLEGTTRSDSGASIRDAFKMLAKTGLALEHEWPYDVKKFAKAPPKPALAEMPAHKVLTYLSVPQDETAMKSALAQGYPIGVGFTVYDSFESDAVAKTGDVPLPGKGESVLGGHAVVVVGYDDATRKFLVRNSWGTSFGLQGYFTIPYAYFLNPKLASDFWTVHTVEG